MLFDFYDANRLVCLVTLFIGLVAIAEIFQGEFRIALVTGGVTAVLFAYLYKSYQTFKKEKQE